jgi:hypothetical protein
VLVALSPSDVVQEASNIVVNDGYSDEDYVPKISWETYQADQVGK